MPGRKQNKKLVIGLTGSFGSGKSTVADIFAASGARRIDADKIAHSCIKPGRRVYAKIIAAFGPGLTGKNNEINRPRLARIVFSDKKKLKQLESILHPEIIKIIRKKISAIKKGVVILDAPLLLEAGLKNIVDKLVVVKINRDEQLRRLLGKKFFKKQDILRRIKAQIPLSAKVCLADFIIDNNGSLTETKKQVEGIMRKFILRPLAKPVRARDDLPTSIEGKSGGKLWKS